MTRRPPALSYRPRTLPQPYTIQPLHPTLLRGSREGERTSPAISDCSMDQRATGDSGRARAGDFAAFLARPRVVSVLAVVLREAAPVVVSLPIGRRGSESEQ